MVYEEKTEQNRDELNIPCSHFSLCLLSVRRQRFVFFFFGKKKKKNRSTEQKCVCWSLCRSKIQLGDYSIDIQRNVSKYMYSRWQ